MICALCSVNPAGTDPLDVGFSRSTDGGLTWSAPVRVNDDAGTGWQWFGTMSTSPSGRIDAIWLDTRDNPGTYLSSLYYSHSDDGGLTWSANERLSEAFDPHLGWPNQDKMGDYYHMVSDDQGFNLAWAATFNGEQDVYYGRMTLGATAAGDTPAAPLALLNSDPNPFTASTTLRYKVPVAGFVSLEVYDALGRRVATLAIPVVSAVGHERDVTLLDDVAAVRASTPTHAADAVIRIDVTEAKNQMARAAGLLGRAGRGAVTSRVGPLAAMAAGPGRAIRAERVRLNQKTREVRASADRGIENRTLATKGTLEKGVLPASSRALLRIGEDMRLNVARPRDLAAKDA